MVNKDIEAVEKALGEPVMCEFSSPIQKIRGTLFFISIIGIALTLGDLQIGSDSSIFGLKFKNLTDDLVRHILFAVTLYLMVHFLWGAIDCFLEWRIRITGTKLTFVTVGKSSQIGGDYPNDPRQSTLYNWWITQAKTVGYWWKDIDDLKSSIEKYHEDLLNRAHEDGSPNWGHAQTNTSKILRRLDKIVTNIKNVDETIHSERIPVSLSRFDNWFQVFLRSQILRWLLIEFALPLGLGSYALLLLNTP